MSSTPIRKESCLDGRILAMSVDYANSRLICHHTRSGGECKEFVDTSPTLHYVLGTRDAELGQFHEVILSAEKALNLARTAGDKELVQKTNYWLELYKKASKFVENSGDR